MVASLDRQLLREVARLSSVEIRDGVWHRVVPETYRCGELQVIVFRFALSVHSQGREASGGVLVVLLRARMSGRRTVPLGFSNTERKKECGY